MDRFNRLFFPIILITLLLLFVAPAFADIEFYMQPPTLNADWWASQNDVGGQGKFVTAYEDFDTFGRPTPFLVDDVEWFGRYVNPGPPGNITGWTISLYSDNAGQPGGAVWARYFSVADPGYMEVCGFGPFSMCSYDMDNIANGYVLMPNTNYWLSVVPDMVAPPLWGWGTSSMGDGFADQDYLGSRYLRNNDLAFNLQGMPVPEPGTLMLLGTGVLGLAGVLRRKLL